MAADLAATPRSRLSAQLCGDAHLSNFGGFAAPDRELVFDLNDFDETFPGPWEWDVKRLGASVAVATRDAGIGARDRRGAVTAVGRAYREAMREFAEMRNLDVWYARLDADEVVARVREGLGGKAAHKVQREMERAERKNSLRALAKLTTRETASSAWSATRRSWCRSLSCSRRRTPPLSSMRSPRSCATTRTRCAPTCDRSCRATAPSTSRGRWWASGASARAHGWC